MDVRAAKPSSDSLILSSAIFLVACVGLNVVGVRAFGTSEVITSLVKIFAFVGLIVSGYRLA
jgi:amino acid permease